MASGVGIAFWIHTQKKEGKFSSAHILLSFVVCTTSIVERALIVVLR
jgi:hypothetical protein